ncbi:MAG: diacylglycerol/lipid kinase family protein [Solirubrobacterales bacterium]
MDHRVGLEERLAAGAALLLAVVAAILIVDFAISSFPAALVPLVLLLVAIAAAWFGVAGTGSTRAAGFVIAALAFGLSIGFVLNNGEQLVEVLLIVGSIAVASYAARKAFSVRVPLPGAAAPSHPVLFYNPKSGGGKAEEFEVAREARARGIEPVELTDGSDLEELVRAAVAGGADGLAMAGGDGSQAVVAAIAAEADLPYACIPAGTRNHFALDLGVDRDDLVGALDAFVDAGERRVDLAEVNGRVFVNNVSLGVYAEAVQRDGYREAKLKTILDTVPEVMGPEADGPGLKWKSPSGREHSSGAAILVSNNRYRLGGSIGSGTRPKIDDGLLGVAILADPEAGGRRLRTFQKPWRDWSSPAFTVDSEEPVPAGIDGEAATIEPPLEFRIQPAVLRVRIARKHPGASPSASIPEGIGKVTVALMRIMAGHPRPALPHSRREIEPRGGA